MPVTRWRDGGVTVVLHDELEAAVRSAMERAAGPALAPLRRRAEDVAAFAGEAWYTLVDRRTGLSGQIDVVETVSMDAVTISVGSTDQRIRKGKPVPAYVRTPGPSSEKRRRPRTGDDPSKIRKGWYYYENPKRQDGRYSLLQVLVLSPMRQQLKAITAELAARLKTEMQEVMDG